MSCTKAYKKIRILMVVLLVASLVFPSFVSSGAFALGPENYDHESSVVSGDGSSYIVSSGEDLSFVFDATLEQLYGAGLLMVDGASIDVTQDCFINANTRTVTLLSRYLDTLSTGEHQLEVLFPDAEQGFARANFTVVESESGPVAPVDPITATYPYYAFIENPDEPWSTVWDALDSTDTIEYSDSYFDQPSPGDHPELRAVSYALALAGFENEADGYSIDGSTPNLKLHTFLNELGFHDYRKWDTSSDDEGHSMGTTIGRKTLPNGQTLIVVAPRNYNYMTEWLSNFNVGTSGDHAGFTESAELVKERLDEYIYVNHLSDYKIWMVGYSRGGAVVDLTAKMINENLSDYDMSADDFYAYTFGAPKASVTETKYSNIHDVKDRNDLLLGYMFPDQWGFYNTGIYEEIHPADLQIATSVIDISDLADSSRAVNVLVNNDGLTREVGEMNGEAFMDKWLDFMVDNGLTREYFDTYVKSPLSAVMQVYQLRTLDKQSEVLNFIKDTSSAGMAGMIAKNAFEDLFSSGYSTIEESLDHYPPYNDLVKLLKGTATDADVDELLDYLTRYIGDYSDYSAPTVTEEEFNILKNNLPSLVKAFAPFIVADAKYTQETYGETDSLYYTYTLISNAEKLVIGHIPESIMPILKSLIPINESSDDIVPDNEEDISDSEEVIAPVPDTGVMTKDEVTSTENYLVIIAISLTAVVVVSIVYIFGRRI